MGVARHPKSYKAGKSQVTVPWKRRVIAKLAGNKKAGAKPANIDQLADLVGAAKGGLNGLLDLDRRPPQFTSADERAITELLKIIPPVLEEDEDDPDFAKDVLLLRALDPDSRRDLMITAARLKRRPGR